MTKPKKDAPNIGKVIEVQGVGPNPDVVIEGRFADRATVSFDQLSERL